MDIHTYEMINAIDDILRCIKEIPPNDDPDGKTEPLYFIHKHDNLLDLLFALIHARYEPKIQYECGRLTGIFIAINKKNMFYKNSTFNTKCYWRTCHCRRWRNL